MAVKTLVSHGDMERILGWSSAKGRKLLFYHNDPDGICSATLWMKAFSGFEPVPREGPMLQDSFVQWIADQDPDLLVFLDLPVDQEEKSIKWLVGHVEGLNVIVVDHHLPDADLNSGNIVHINNKFVRGLEGKYIPASYLVCKILDSAGIGMESCKWVAGVGIVGDYGQKDCASMLRGAGGLKKLGAAADLIAAAVTLKGRQGAGRALKIMLNADGIEDLLGRKTLALWKKQVDKEVARVLQDYEREKEEMPGMGMVIFRLNSRLNMVSVISTLLSGKYPDKAIIIYKLSSNGLWKVSGRLQSGRLDLGSMFKKCVRGIGSGGGHPKAAGARVRDWNKFRKRLVSHMGGAK